MTTMAVLGLSGAILAAGATARTHHRSGLLHHHSTRHHHNTRHHRRPRHRSRMRRHCRFAHTRVGHTSRRHFQAAVVCLINKQRTRRGLPRLHQSQRLNRSAQGWTNHMVRDRSFSHGSNFSARISAVGFNWSMVGENIATGFATPAAAVRAWMHSPDHCRNILAPTFRDVGTGVSRRGVAGASRLGTWTQDFGLPMLAAPPSGNWGPASGCPY
ncbi:MAG: CAP domain-containing protein [Actinomycetota bacterium]|nr:CAP domain-containing protein [Actinomycetota bacterium]